MRHATTMNGLAASGRLAAVALGAALLAATIAGPALADNTISFTIVAGPRTASVDNLTFAPLTASASGQTARGTLVLTADDRSGSGAGWNVTVVSSDFVGSGTAAGTSIPAANFLLTSAATPVAIAGQPIEANDPVAFSAGSLDEPRSVLRANAGFGGGAYREALGVSLVIPAGSPAGTYTGTLTTTISAAP